MLSEAKIAHIYDLYSREIFIYLLRMVHDHEQAEDLLHDCFVSLINYSTRYHVDETSIRAFLYRTAHNHAINYIKRNSRIAFTPLDEDHPNAEQGPETALFMEDMERRISLVLSESDPLNARIFIMRKEMGMEVENIAVELGISERTVRRRLKLVLDDMMSALHNDGFLINVLFPLSLFMFLVVSLTEGLHG